MQPRLASFVHECLPNLTSLLAPLSVHQHTHISEGAFVPTQHPHSLSLQISFHTGEICKLKLSAMPNLTDSPPRRSVRQHGSHSDSATTRQVIHPNKERTVIVDRKDVKSIVPPGTQFVGNNFETYGSPSVEDHDYKDNLYILRDAPSGPRRVHTYAEICQYTPQEVIEWQDRIGYLPAYAAVPAVRDGITKFVLHGKVLMTNGGDIVRLERFLPVEPSAELARIVNRLRNEHSEKESNRV